MFLFLAPRWPQLSFPPGATSFLTQQVVIIYIRFKSRHAKLWEGPDYWSLLTQNFAWATERISK